MAPRKNKASSSAPEAQEPKRRITKAARTEKSPVKEEEASDAEKKPGTTLKVKLEKADPEEQRRMLAKLHYLKKTGKPAAYEEYMAKDLEGKRAWFHEVYKHDPSLAKFNQTVKSRIVFKTDESMDVEEWMTEKQIMAHNGYHDELAPDYESVKAALLAGLKVRDHEKPEMAKLKIKQYNYNRQWTSQSSGSKREDSLMMSGEIDERVAANLARHFDKQDFAVPEVEPQITLEPWKKEALDLEKKIGAAHARLAKCIQTGQSQNLKLLRVINGSNPNKSGLAQAQQQNLEEKLAIILQCQRDFTVSISEIDSKTEARAKRMQEVAEPAMAVVKEHCTGFEKVLTLTKNYLNMVD